MAGAKFSTPRSSQDREHWNAENHSVPMVRRPGRRGHEPLRLHLQELEGGENHPLWRPRAGAKGSVLTATFQLEGQEFMALNGGPMFQFSPAISFFVSCETQQEVDDLWNKLSAGGETQQCGWLKDKFGVSWQIIPTALGKWMNDPDPARAKRVVQAMLQMDKIDIA